MGRQELTLEIAKVVDRLDQEITATPTGELRNLLTDSVIVIRALQGELSNADARLAQTKR